MQVDGFPNDNVVFLVVDCAVDAWWHYEGKALSNKESN
jgi:hypothetical protein